MIEYLFRSHLDRMQYLHGAALRPENGWLALSVEPGLGFSLDEGKISERREVGWL